MADFSTPFASTGPRRNPDATEKANGFPCGPADQLLFNGLFHRLESEIGSVISFAGLKPTDTQYNQLLQAIQALINAATGGGEKANYLLLSQAASRLPIYPRVLSSDGRINVTSPAGGTVRLPGGVTLLHRGVVPVVTAQTDFATVSNRTYHLRWNPVDGFTLKDLSNNAYNPLTLAESDGAFDSTLDDALIARVVTNSSGVATITNLANMDRFLLQTVVSGTITEFPANNGAAGTASITYNLARYPGLIAVPGAINTKPTEAGAQAWDFGANSQVHDHDYYLQIPTQSRYGATMKLSRDYAHDQFSLNVIVTL